MKLNYILIIGLVLAALLVAGCTGSQDASNPTNAPVSSGDGNNPIVTIAPTPVPTAVVTPTPISMSGSGNQASQIFHLNRGLAVFSAQNSNCKYGLNFIIYLLDNNGNKIDLIANAIGNGQSSAAINVKEPGDYLLDITSDGDWNVQVTQPNYSTAQAVPITLSGNGNQASQPFYLKSGLARFESSNTNSKNKLNFIIYLLDKDGNKGSLIANDIGDGDSSKAISVYNSGVYLLDVTSDGDWQVKISQ